MKSRKTQNYGSFNQSPRSTFHEKLDLCTIMKKVQGRPYWYVQASVGYMDLYVWVVHVCGGWGGVNS